MEDAALADLLNLDPDDLGRRRWRALERLAEELGTEPGIQLEEDLLELWGEGEPRALPFGDPVSPAAPRSRRGNRRAGVVLVAAAVAIAAGVVVGAVSGDDDDEETGEPATSANTTTTRTARTAPPPPPRVRLEPVGQARGTAGSVQLQRRQRLRISVRGLPAGQYTAWLYTSIADAVPIARFDGGSHTEQVQLPEEAPRFRYLDVSREPPDGNPNHSGESVLRAPLDRVLGSA